MKNVFLGIAIVLLFISGFLCFQSAQISAKMEKMDTKELTSTAKAYLRIGKIKEAEMHITKSLEKDSTNKETQCYNLLILMKAKKYSKAYEESKKVAEMYPDDPFVLTTVGTTYMANKDYEGAEKLLLKSIEIEPIHVSYRALGMAYKAQKKYDEAIEAYTQAINMKPDTLKYHKERRRICRKAGYDKCVEEDRKKIRELMKSK